MQRILMIFEKKRNPVFSLLAVALLFGIIPLLLCKSMLPTIMYDGLGYYIYLPAILVYNDPLKLTFVPEMIWQYGNTHEFYQATQLPNGNFVFGYTAGVAMLQLPFFLCAHLLAKLFFLKADGFSAIYQYLAYVSGVFYGLLGLYNTSRIVFITKQKYTTAITIVCLLLSTNLFYYLFVENGMGHIYSFFLFSQLFVSFNNFLQTKTTKHLLLLGFTFGLLFLIRPTNSVVLLPLLFAFSPFSFDAFKKRLTFFWYQRGKLVSTILVALCPILIQSIYWKIATGHYFFNPYANMGLGFTFSHAHFHYGWFGTQRGLFFYSPILLLSILGLVLYRKKNSVSSFIILAYFLLNSWIIYSWKVYSYGGSYGARPMVESFVVLALPLSNSIAFLLRKTWTKILLYVLIGITIGLNLLQTYKYVKGAISGYSDAEIRYSYFSIDDLRINNNQSYATKKPQYVWQKCDTILLCNEKPVSPTIEFRCDTLKGEMPKALIIKARGMYERLNLWKGKRNVKIIYTLSHGTDTYSWKESYFEPQTQQGDTCENILIDYRKLPMPLEKKDIIKIFVFNAGQNNFRLFGFKAALYDFEKEK